MVRHIVFAIVWAIVFLFIGVGLYVIGVIAVVVLTGKRDGADGTFQFIWRLVPLATIPLGAMLSALGKLPGSRGPKKPKGKKPPAKQ